MLKKTLALILALLMSNIVFLPTTAFASDSNYACNLGGLWTNEVYEKEDTVNTNIGENFNMHFADFVTVGSEIWAYYNITADAYGKLGIGLAKSTDGVNFTNYGAVLSTTPNAWDGDYASFGGIYYYNNVFYLVYEGSGTNNPGAIGLATSTDGMNFTKQGIILSHNAAGWESVNIGTPDLNMIGSTWYLTYHGFDGVTCQVGVASGTNIYSLIKNANNPVIATSTAGADSGTIGRRDITYYNGYYYMVYEISTKQPYSTAKWSHTFARSTNMINWSKLPQSNIIAQTNYDWGNDGPAFVTLLGVTWIYYRHYSGYSNSLRRARLANELNGGYNRVTEAEAMYHQAGRTDGEGWSANTTQDTAGFIAYGFYASDIPIGETTGIFKAKIDNITASDDAILRLEAVDLTQGKIVASREITRHMFTSTNHYEFFSLPFNNYYSSHNIEFRVYWYAKAYTNIDRVLVNYGNSCRIPPTSWLFEAENLKHQIGRVDGTALSANTAQDIKGYLALENYTADIATGLRKVSFKMKTDNNTADNLCLARIEVYNGTTGVVVAQNSIRRTQFTAINQYQDFDLIFNNTTEGDSFDFRVYWSGYAMVALDNILVAQASHTSWLFEAETMYHQIGRADGNGWSANTTQDTEGYLIYGPYAADIATGLRKVTYKMKIDNNTADNLTMVRIEVNNVTTGTVVAQKNITRTQFTTINQYQDFDLAFNSVTSGHTYEFRVYWYRRSTINVDNISVNQISSLAWLYDAEAMYNQVGRVDGDGWSANSVQDSAGYLVFGPYTKSIQAGLRTATYKMKIDNNTANNLNMVRLEVFDTTTATVLAQNNITRTQFTTVNQYQDFDLAFTNATAGDTLEFRVYWYGYSQVTVDCISVASF